jgi:hypothetical protein
MTLFGKILVLLNVTLSLLMAAWAIGVYTNHLHWGIDKSVQQSEFEVNELRDRLASGKGASLYDNLGTAEARWKTASPVFQTMEPLWAKNQKWYQEHLAELQTSAKPVKTPSYKAGQLEFDPNNFGLPLMVEATDKGGKPFTSGLAPYKKDYDDKQAAIKVAMDDLKNLIAEDKDLTVEIGGKNGLRAKIEREADKKQRVLAELDYLKPLLVNSLVEGELLLKRQADLEARVKQLRATPVAASR